MLLIGSAAPAANVSLLIDRLEHGEDFRVRVQAALELGKTKNSTVRAPLEKALDDENAAVRAAAAAALKALGDKRAIPALERHKKDSSPAVRSQVQHSIAALRAVVHAEKTRVLVKLGKMKDAKGVRTGKLLGEMEQTSRQKFDELPGVKVVDGTPDEKIPLVMVTGSVRKLRTSREGSDVVYSASVEYIVHRMPEQAIAGTVSGSASTKASRAEARDKRRSFELKRTVLAAAVESAVKRAPEALFAAAK
ncbi:MAG: HEAT repeat domain-containing protein [Myxococcales bacterium]|nr:HEAT repeat domain-containing protein [Myxococcales bacterium]MCB9576522.1 HEAT repeat domain-containing protein [Polyangiaceae bacterium]